MLIKSILEHFAPKPLSNTELFDVINGPETSSTQQSNAAKKLIAQFEDRDEFVSHIETDRYPETHPGIPNSGLTVVSAIVTASESRHFPISLATELRVQMSKYDFTNEVHWAIFGGTTENAPLRVTSAGFGRLQVSINDLTLSMGENGPFSADLDSDILRDRLVSMGINVKRGDPGMWQFNKYHINDDRSLAFVNKYANDSLVKTGFQTTLMGLLENSKTPKESLHYIQGVLKS